MTEAEHIDGLFKPVEDGSAIRWVLRPWRGLAFFGNASIFSCYTYTKEKILQRIDTCAWIGPEGPGEKIAANIMDWVRQCCSNRSLKAVPLFPVDDIPWEIHEIEDFPAYLSALEAYRVEANMG